MTPRLSRPLQSCRLTGRINHLKAAWCISCHLNIRATPAVQALALTAVFALSPRVPAQPTHMSVVLGLDSPDFQLGAEPCHTGAGWVCQCSVINCNCCFAVPCLQGLGVNPEMQNCQIVRLHRHCTQHSQQTGVKERNTTWYARPSQHGLAAQQCAAVLQGGETAALARLADKLKDKAWVAQFEKPKGCAPAQSAAGGVLVWCL